MGRRWAILSVAAAVAVMCAGDNGPSDVSEQLLRSLLAPYAAQDAIMPSAQQALESALLANSLRASHSGE